MLRLGRALVSAVLILSAATGVLAQDKVEYYHVDAVGSVRAVTAANATTVVRHDYFPFGEEYLPSPPTNDTKRFVGKERDAETSFDYFGARYYVAKSARFTTIDPVYTWQENLADPQRWNRYAYARNNPLRYTDPDGRCIYPGSSCAQYALGVAKSIGNLVPDTASLINSVVDSAIAPLTDFRFGQTARFQPSNEDQRRGMFAGDIMLLLAPAIRASGVQPIARAVGTSVAEEIGILREAAAGRGDFGLGSATASDADRLGRAWVGNGYRVSRDGKTLISKDELRQYRPPTYKPNQGRLQANFEQRSAPRGAFGSNGHLDIK